jgi:alpha-tubulin suppressor-like RCC1 family protein
MSFRYPAGVVGKTVTPSGSYQTSTAPGIWSLAGQANFKAQSLWPTQGNLEPQPYLWSWGGNSQGQLGLGNTTYFSSPKQVGISTTWAQVSTGLSHTVAVQKNGTLWAWGLNSSGQLGLGNTTYAFSSPVQVGALTTWLQSASGQDTTLAIKTDGTLWSWGLNTYGSLGLGNTTTYSSPKQVGSLTNWKIIATCTGAVISIKTDGTLWGWGFNGYGALGLNNITNYSSPKQIGALTTWSAIGTGSEFTLAVKTDGTLWTWGANNYGQLGFGNTTNYSSPKQVGGLTNWKTVSGTNVFSAAIKTDGTLWTWGRNVIGELGLGNTTNYSSPKQVGSLTNWSKISNGPSIYSLSIKTDGTLWSWGYNANGQLGFSNTTNYSSPKQVGALSTWLSIAIGGSGSSLTIKNS